MYKNLKKSLSIFFLVSIILSAISPLAAAGGRNEFNSSKELDRVIADYPYERWDNSRGKYLEVFFVVLKEGTNAQYKDKDFAYSVACELRDGYLTQQSDLPWAEEMLNEYVLTQILIDAAENDPDGNQVKISIDKENDYNPYLIQKEKLNFGNITGSQAICNVGNYYYGLRLNDSSAEQTEAVLVFPDADTYMAYMTATENKEKWDNVKSTAGKFVERVNTLYPGKVNPNKVLVFIENTEFSYFAISNDGYQVTENWPTMAEDSYCFAMSPTAVRTYYDLAGVREIIFNADAISQQIVSFADANGSPMNRIQGQIKAELELHAAGWLITKEGSSWHRRAMPADININASILFVDCIFDVS